VRITSMLMVAWLGLAACSVKRGSQQVRTPLEVGASPQVAASRYSEADSAAVLAAVVDEMLEHDRFREAVERKFSTEPRGQGGEPRVFVRIGAMPKSTWASPIVARLRDRQWFYEGRAVDSTRALAGLEDRPAARWRRPFPAELMMRVEFVGDTAQVAEDWILWFCKTQPRSMSVLHEKTHLFVRTPSGWQESDVRRGAMADLASCR
jgi:hypothetical protein